MTFSQVVRRALQDVWAFPGKALVLFLTMAYDTGYETLSPLIFAWVVDQVLLPGRPELFPGPALLLTLGWILSALGQLGRDRIHGGLTAAVLSAYRRRLSESLERMPWQKLKKLDSGEMAALLGRDITLLENFYLNVFPLVFFAFLYILLGLGALFFADPLVGMVLLLLLPLSFVGSWILGPKAVRSGEEASREEAEANEKIAENRLAQGLLRVLSVPGGLGGRFDRANSRWEGLARRFYFLNNLNRRMPNLAIHMMQLVILLGGAFLVLQGWLALGLLLALPLIFSNLTTAVVDLASTFSACVQAGVAFRRLEDFTRLSLMESGRASDPPTAPAAPEASGGLMEVREAGVKGEDGRDILSDISFRLHPGEWTALVGPSGSGKSTLINLLAGLQLPYAGSAGLSGTGSRPRCAMVFQENPVLSGTLRENLTLGMDPEPVEDFLKDCLIRADLGEVLGGAPQGLDQLLGNRGLILSGGQRQRLALARALVRDPDILFLDEPTSALDPLSESQILNTLEGLRGQCTIFHASHNLRSIRSADRILVLDHGRLAEQGTHEDLLAREGGLYARLWARQSGLLKDGEGRFRLSAEALASFDLFRSVDPAVRKELAELFVEERVEAGDLIIRQDTPGQRFCIIASGRAEVIIRSPGRPPLMVAALTAGDFFGEMSLLDSIKTSADVRALGEIILLTLDRSTFKTLLARDPVLAEHIRSVAEERRRKNQAQSRNSPSPSSLEGSSGEKGVKT